MEPSKMMYSCFYYTIPLFLRQQLKRRRDFVFDLGGCCRHLLEGVASLVLGITESNERFDSFAFRRELRLGAGAHRDAFDLFFEFKDEALACLWTKASDFREIDFVALYDRHLERLKITFRQDGLRGLGADAGDAGEEFKEVEFFRRCKAE